jgi:triacylglycerol esterase/lipase EstA (alpha/beta hydrolase family)
MADSTHHVFLVPGFFGFANLGEIPYFAHVRRYLPQALAGLGIQAEVHPVSTFPTSSIRKRAALLLEQIAEVAGQDRRPIHLIGHSSGGLDARLLVTPQGSLRTKIDSEPLARRVRTVVMVSTPNHGTPVASFFSSIFGQQLLRLLSLGTIYALWFGRLPVSVVFKLAAAMARTGGALGKAPSTLLDQIYTRLLRDFSEERREAIEHFMIDVGNDQSLLPQLTPEGIDALNAATGDRPGIRYGSVVNYARRPGLVSTAMVGLSPYDQATHALFYAMYRIASGLPEDHLPNLSDQQADVLLQTYGMIPEIGANDGIVPTVSQIWGEVVHATMADHLDVLGHFGQGKSSHDPDHPHIDWLASGSGFDRPRFEALWTDVASFITGREPRAARGQDGPRVQHLLHLFSRK